MPHVDASLDRGQTVTAYLPHRPSKATRRLRGGAALALCALVAACSSDGSDGTDPLNESTGSTATIDSTSSSTTATTSTVSSTSTATTTGFGAVNSTTSSASTTGGTTTATVTTTGTTGFGGNTASSSSDATGSTTSSTGAGGASSTGGTTSDTSTETSTTGSMTCETGTVAANEVLVIGESFIALTHGLTRAIEENARAAGALGAGESYRDNSISGTTLAGGGNSIPNQYQNGVNQGPVKVVLMDGGGNDCLQANNPSGALSAAEGLFQNMQANGTEQVVYFFYPDPIGGQFSSLKSCLDTLRPQMKALCDGLTTPKCYWLDLREVWDGHPEYTNDGIHPTSAGDQATGKAIWDVMVENCVAQ